jgi:hypothetical protein
MFWECSVAGCSLDSVGLAVLYIAILHVSYLLNNEQLEGKGDGESLVWLPAHMLVSHFTSHFRLVQYAGYHLWYDPNNGYYYY